MKKIKVYGCSDDLVCIDVDDVHEAEFDCYDEVAYLMFDDGTMLSVTYGDDGMWSIRVRREGTVKVSVQPATDVDTDYSDKAFMEFPDRTVHVVFGKEETTL